MITHVPYNIKIGAGAPHWWMHKKSGELEPVISEKVLQNESNTLEHAFTFKKRIYSFIKDEGKYS